MGEEQAEALRFPLKPCFKQNNSLPFFSLHLRSLGWTQASFPLPLTRCCPAFQIYENAMITAGLVDDPRPMVGRLNHLLVKALERH